MPENDPALEVRDRSVNLGWVLGVLRGRDSDDHEFDEWMRTAADLIEREASQ